MCKLERDAEVILNKRSEASQCSAFMSFREMSRAFFKLLLLFVHLVNKEDLLSSLEKVGEKSQNESGHIGV